MNVVSSADEQVVNKEEKAELLAQVLTVSQLRTVAHVVSEVP